MFGTEDRRAIWVCFSSAWKPPKFLNVISVAVMVVCMFIMVIKLEDKLILTIVTTMISVMTALMYIPPPEAMELKILWVTVAVVVVTLFNYKFLKQIKK